MKIVAQSGLLIIGAFSLMSALPAKTKRTGDQRDFIADAVMPALKTDIYKHSRKKVISTITPVDINGDGLTDYQMDWGKLGSPAWCGTGGCRYQLWLGTSAGAPVKLFDRMQRTVSIRPAPARIFDFDFHGGTCGGSGSALCPASYTFNPKTNKLMQVKVPGQKKIKHKISAFEF